MKAMYDKIEIHDKLATGQAKPRIDDPCYYFQNCKFDKDARYNSKKKVITVPGDLENHKSTDKKIEKKSVYCANKKVNIYFLKIFCLY
jgi:hypothetical protein